MATRVVALWAGLLIVLAGVVPVLAVQGPTKLDNPAVSPRTALSTTTITFAVRYRNREGSPPDHVNVLIDGAAHRMSGAGTSWKSGVVLEWSVRLAVGTHSVSFEAADTRKFTDAIDAGSVTITAPPSPTPAPTATPKPTPKPTAKPTPTAAPTTAPTPTPTANGGSVDSPRSTPSTPSPSSSPAPGSGFVPGPNGGPGSTGDGSAGGGPTGGGGQAPGVGSGDATSGGSAAGAGGLANGDTNGETTVGSAGGRTGSFGSAVGTAGIGPDGRGRAAGDGSGWGTLARALDALGVRPSSTTTVLPMLVGTTTATAMAFAFAIFGKKRRDQEPPAPDEVLQAQAARGVAAVHGGEVIGVVRSPLVAAPADAEAGMPRWRRPSLLEARKADPSRVAAATLPRMSFANGAVSAVDGRERRVIRYRVVRLLDAPDELRSADIGQLDQGDEVQLVDRSGSYWLVLCPDGRQGWVHKMTLGDVVSDAPRDVGLPPEIDDDVLRAFIAARSRA